MDIIIAVALSFSHYKVCENEAPQDAGWLVVVVRVCWPASEAGYTTVSCRRQRGSRRGWRSSQGWRWTSDTPQDPVQLRPCRSLCYHSLCLLLTVSLFISLSLTVCLFVSLSVFLPWHNCTGWLGIKLQVTYLLCVFVSYYIISLSPRSVQGRRGGGGGGGGMQGQCNTIQLYCLCVEKFAFWHRGGGVMQGCSWGGGGDDGSWGGCREVVGGGMQGVW